MMTPNTQAGIAAGVAVAQSVAPAFGPVAAAAVNAASALLAAVMTSVNTGVEMTLADFAAAVALDDAAIADDLLAQQEAISMAAANGVAP